MDVSLLAYLPMQINLNDSIASTLDFLNKQSGILTLSSIVAAIAVFFYQQHNERKKFDERLHRSYNTLLLDIAQIEEAFLTDKFKKTKIGNDIDFTNTSIGTEFYRSIVNSGLFTYFNEMTQIKLPDFYYNIILFNQATQEIIRAYLSSSISKENLENVQKQLTKYERKIKELLPEVKELLEKEVKEL